MEEGQGCLSWSNDAAWLARPVRETGALGEAGAEPLYHVFTTWPNAQAEEPRAGRAEPHLLAGAPQGSPAQDVRNEPGSLGASYWPGSPG